jgi:hypothetical protein
MAKKSSKELPKYPSQNIDQIEQVEDEKIRRQLASYACAQIFLLLVLFPLFTADLDSTGAQLLGVEDLMVFACVIFAIIFLINIVTILVAVSRDIKVPGILMICVNVMIIFIYLAFFEIVPSSLNGIYGN